MEQHSSCFNPLSLSPSCALSHTNTHASHPPLRQSRSQTLALPQDMRGSCVSQAKSWRSPPPHFLPAPPPASPVPVTASAQSRSHLMVSRVTELPPLGQIQNELPANGLQCKMKRKERERAAETRSSLSSDWVTLVRSCITRHLLESGSRRPKSGATG